jgi:putative membrane protein
MTLNRVRIGVLCTAALMLPSLALAQMGNSPNQPNNNQPAQPNQQPGTAPGGAGMAGAMTGTGPGGGDQTMRDQMFVRKAAEGGMAEIQMGQLAAQKGSSDDVKQFGQKMVDDHMMLNEGMKPVAEQMGVRAPNKLNKKDQEEYDKLNGLSGEDFDKEYLMAMVKDHRQDLREFRMEDSATQNTDLKGAVDKAIPVIQQHMQMVAKMARDKGIMPAGRGEHPVNMQ